MMRPILIAMMPRLLAIAALLACSCAAPVRYVLSAYCNDALVMQADVAPGSGQLHPIPNGNCAVRIDKKE